MKLLQNIFISFREYGNSSFFFLNHFGISNQQCTSKKFIIPFFRSIIQKHYKISMMSKKGIRLGLSLASQYATSASIEGIMVRHAQSEFNKYVHLPKQFLDAGLRENLHHNTRLIDCSLTTEGVAQAQNAMLPAAYLQQSKQVDIIFVSPLTRALQTAQILIATNRLNVKQVIVLPELTEVLSKICDLSGPIENKRQRFPKFDFSQMARFVKENNGDQQMWQDGQVDNSHRTDILTKESFGQRYLKILQKVFPVPLQSSERCFERSLRALQLMKRHSSRLRARRVLVVSHNRILKYLDGRFANGKAPAFQNCEMRKLIF